MEVVSSQEWSDPVLVGDGFARVVVSESAFLILADSLVISMIASRIESELSRVAITVIWSAKWTGSV